MRVAIVGAGQIAKAHGSIILKQPNAKIVSVCDKHISRAKTTAKELNAQKFYEDATVMLSEQKPDVVHVLTPPQLHAELSMLAMDHGCHVLVEKPMALTIHAAEQMIETARRNNVKLCVNHNLVYENLVQKAIQLFSEGIIGEMISVEASLLFNAYRYPAILEDGAEYCHWSYQLDGGPLQDLIPHPASLVCEFVKEIKDVEFVGENRGILPRPWHDELRVLIKSDGAIGYICLSLSERPDTILLDIRGTKGSIKADLFSNILILQKESALPRAVARGLSGFSITSQYLKNSLRNVLSFATGNVDKSNGLAPLIWKFYEAIRSGGETPVSVSRSLNVVELMTRIWPPALVGGKKIQPHDSARGRPAKPTVLVTGASGFIGTHLVKKLLVEKHSVRALVRPNSIHAGRLVKVDVDIVEGDLSDAQAIAKATKGIKTIYHAGSAVNNSWEEHEEITINGTELLVKAALAQEVERFVHFSTLAVYELLDFRGSEITEDCRYQKDPKGMGPYAYAKIEAEKIVFDAYLNNNLGITVVRPGIVFGPMGRIFFPHLGFRYQDKLFLLVGKGNTVLPLTYVENTVDGIYKASISEKAIGQVYNLVDDAQITVRNYLEQFIKITGVEARLITFPFIIPYFAAGIYEIAAKLSFVRKGITSRSQLRWKQSPVRFDNSKAKSELGWKPEISMEDAMDKTFRWYCRQYIDAS